MDYRYIEQLIERYFHGETTLSEEKILREFFAQDDVPAHLKQWQPLFAAQQQVAEAHLTADFDQRLLSIIAAEQGDATSVEQPAQPRIAKPRRSLYMHLRPLMRSAAILAFAIAAGTVLQHTNDYQSPVPTEMAESGYTIEPAPTTQPEMFSAEAIEQLDSTLITTQ